MKKILLFGTGFIAANLIDYFYTEYESVDCAVVYNKTRISSRHAVRQYPMTDSVESIFRVEKPDCLIVLHGNSYVPDNVDISESVTENLLKSISFLEEVWKRKLFADLRKIIVVGSASEYGRLYHDAIREDFPLYPTSIYGFSKICLYNATQLFVNRGLPIVYVRQFNVIGPGQRESFVLPTFLRSLALIEKHKSEPVLDVGDLSQERDFIDVRDLCRAYDLLLDRGIVGDVYNVASGEYVIVERLLQLAIEASDLDPDKLSIRQNQDLFLGKENLCTRLHADIMKLRALGFERRYLLKQTVKNTLDYWRDNV